MRSRNRFHTHGLTQILSTAYTRDSSDRAPEAARHHTPGSPRRPVLAAEPRACPTDRAGASASPKNRGTSQVRSGPETCHEDGRDDRSFTSSRGSVVVEGGLFLATFPCVRGPQPNVCRSGCHSLHMLVHYRNGKCPNRREISHPSNVTVDVDVTQKKLQSIWHTINAGPSLFFRTNSRPARKATEKHSD